MKEVWASENNIKMEPVQVTSGLVCGGRGWWQTALSQVPQSGAGARFEKVRSLDPNGDKWSWTEYMAGVWGGSL